MISKPLYNITEKAADYLAKIVEIVTRIEYGTSNQVTNQVARVKSILAFCAEPRSRDEIQQHIGISNRGYFRTNILKPLLEAGKLKMTIPDKPNSKNQKYIRV